MAQEIINIGALPNDGTGDPLRVAFTKVNNNFSSLFTEYTPSGPDGAIQYNIVTLGSGAEAESVIAAGLVVDFNIISSGSGYKSTNPPAVSITPAFGDSTGFGAVAQAIVTDGEVTGLVIVSSGSDYTLPPVVEISDTVTAEFEGSAKLTFDSANNVLSSGVDFIPQIDSFYTIGNTDYRFGSAYLNGDGLFLGNVQVSESANVITMAVSVNTSIKADINVGNVVATNLSGNSVTFGNSTLDYVASDTYGPTQQVIFQVPAENFLSGKFDIYSAEANTVNTQSATVIGTKSGDGTSIQYVVTNALYGNQPVVSDYEMDVQSGNIRILVTPLTSEETVTHKITYQKVV